MKDLFTLHKTDDVIGIRREVDLYGQLRPVMGSSEVKDGFNDFFSTNIEVKELTVVVNRMYLHGA